MKGDNNNDKNVQRSSLLGTNLSGCCHDLFLNPAYSLRRQMLLTFGTVTSLTILLVMIVSIIAAVATGDAIKDQANVNVEEWVDGYTVSTSRLVAEALSPKIMVSALEIFSLWMCTAQGIAYGTDFFHLVPHSSVYCISPLIWLISWLRLHEIDSRDIPKP